jgi:hypothetical protein
MRQAEIQSCTFNPNGSVSLRFTDGSGVDLPSRSALQQFGQSIEYDPDCAKKLLIAWWQSRSADFANFNLVSGKRLTFDLSSPSPIKVQ